MKKSTKPLLIYHDHCPDGFGAAFSFWKKYNDEIDYLALDHVAKPFKGLSIKTFQGREVWMADISLEREDAIQANEVAKKFKILDHHISAQKDLLDLDFAHFDMNHSGAILSWKYCFPDEEVPKLLQYVEDRDLRGPAGCILPYARELLAAIDSYPKEFSTWEHLDELIETPEGFSKLLVEGAAILRYNKVLIDSIMENTYRTSIKGYDVPVVNTPFFRSEMLGTLAIGEHFSAGYHYDGEQFQFSLRSTDEGLDVSEIAQQFPGGGGHKKAAGFSVKKLDKIK
jgi:oligoribonuclease NrnB/cAMP/cGMP phosphodiesterase (DHH superfamily)